MQLTRRHLSWRRVPADLRGGDDKDVIQGGSGRDTFFGSYRRRYFHRRAGWIGITMETENVIDAVAGDIVQRVGN